jgi:hypothetical protein
MLTTVIGQHTSSLTPRTLLSQINLARMDQLWWRHSMETQGGNQNVCADNENISKFLYILVALSYTVYEMYFLYFESIFLVRMKL